MISFEKWSEINEDELTCIFAESGADREIDFDREKAEEELYNKQPEYNLIWNTPTFQYKGYTISTTKPYTIKLNDNYVRYTTKSVEDSIEIVTKIDKAINLIDYLTSQEGYITLIFIAKENQKLLSELKELL
jgi:hypothetical protein